MYRDLGTPKLRSLIGERKRAFTPERKKKVWVTNDFTPDLEVTTDPFTIYHIKKH